MDLMKAVQNSFKIFTAAETQDNAVVRIYETEKQAEQFNSTKHNKKLFE